MTTPPAIPDPVREGEIPFPDMPSTRTERHAIPYHQVLLVFRDDDHALLFRDWLQGDGWAAFGAHLASKSTP